MSEGVPMKAKRRWPRVTIETVLWIAVLGFVGYRLGPQVGAALGVGDAGPPAADIRVTTLEGESIRLSDLRGQVVLVNFWATWCAPCRVEMPGFEKVYEKYRDRGFSIVALSTDRGETGAVADWVGERGLTFPIGMASAEAVRAFGGARTLPTSFLIDRQGRIRHTVRGLFARPALDQAVARLLSESGQ
ncbi:MAG TPA: TlpA disulfide reductase family protein [Longimicrobiales bacterium]|nr:TlpA disulfide reductase family protein [Longimicrobiales bacterium]